jgi:hypothetical protein
MDPVLGQMNLFHILVTVCVVVVQMYMRKHVQYPGTNLYSYTK